MNNKTYPTTNDTGEKQAEPNNTPTRLPKIVVIDSGAGGLSIVIEILKLVPSVEILYTADTAHFPYGELPKSDLLQRLDYLVSQTKEKFDPDLFVLACNTASTIGLEYLRNNHSAHFVGVVPAIKPAAKHSKTGNFAVLATRSTVTTDYIKDLVQTFAANQVVSYLGTNELVQIAEDHIAGKPISPKHIEDLLINLFQKSGVKNVEQCDTVVLACTHFPLIKDFISQAFSSAMNKIKSKNLDETKDCTLNHKLSVLDSGEAIAKRVLSLLLTTHRYQPMTGDTYAKRKQSITFITSSKKIATQTSLRYAEYLESKTDQLEIHSPLVLS